MNTEPELLNERLERLAMVLDEIMPNCALLVRDAIALLNDCDTQLQYRDDHIAMYQAEIKRLEALLKEQEAVEPEMFMDGQVERYKCRKCGKHLLYASFAKDNYCSKCGQAVKCND